MRTPAPAIYLLGLLAASALGCIDHEGQLAVFLTDTSRARNISARQVNVEVISVEIRDADNGTFTTLSRGAQVHELVGLGGRSSLLALAPELERGTFSEIRLTFSAGNSSVLDDRGRLVPLIIDPLTATVPAAFTVLEDASTDVLLDIDLDASLSLRNNGDWILRPVVRHTVGSNRARR